jgi:hypothetical protein
MAPEGIILSKKDQTPGMNWYIIKITGFGPLISARKEAAFARIRLSRFGIITLINPRQEECP